jgi:hypothetical protein
MGTMDAGFGLSAWDRGGGYYIGRFRFPLGASFSPPFHLAFPPLLLFLLHPLCETSFRYQLIMIYADVGASQLIIDGKIKLKNDSQISEFTERGLKFDDGSELPMDVVVFATGCVSHCLIHPSLSPSPSFHLPIYPDAYIFICLFVHLPPSPSPHMLLHNRPSTPMAY